MFVGLGLGTIAQFAPFHISVSVVSVSGVVEPSRTNPTAMQNVDDVHDTEVRKLRPVAGFGLGATDHTFEAAPALIVPARTTAPAAKTVVTNAAPDLRTSCPRIIRP